LKLNGKRQILSYVDANLIIHDASIKFLVDDFEDEIKQYDITVSGFDFYQKPSFTVLFTTPSITESYRLSREESRCFGTHRVMIKADGINYTSTLCMILLLPVGWSLVLISKTRSPKTPSPKRFS